jgi:hypothetical protein
MWTVTINDGFCEYKYEFSGGNGLVGVNNSIDDVARAILNGIELKLMGTPVLMGKRPEKKPKKLKTRFELLKENK